MDDPGREQLNRGLGIIEDVINGMASEGKLTASDLRSLRYAFADLEDAFEQLPRESSPV